jgi:hypothetical protein
VNRLGFMSIPSSGDGLYPFWEEFSGRRSVPGFTASDAEGHGPTVRLHSAAEQVKGRADRVLIRIILDDAAAAQVITGIEQAFAGSHLVYWTTPVLSFGVIA